MNERGSVVRVALDPVVGSEQAGTRPAIVVSTEILNEGSRVLLVAPITTKKVDRIHPFEARIDHEACGLEWPSKAMLNQVRVVSKERVVGAYGLADAATMDAVDAAIRITLGI